MEGYSLTPLFPDPNGVGFSMATSPSHANGPWGQFPTTRPRRNRRHGWSRRMVAESALSASDLIWPLFVQEGTDQAAEIPSMPGVERLTIDRAVQAVGQAVELGIPAVALFPVTAPELKTPDALEGVMSFLQKREPDWSMKVPGDMPDF